MIKTKLETKRGKNRCKENSENLVSGMYLLSV
jgi:hypothetical protein